MRVLWRMIAGIFKWTWRVLNFVREFILNLFLILLILIGVGIWLHVSSANAPTEVQKGALIFDLSGVVVDKPSVSNKLSKIGRQLLGASSATAASQSMPAATATTRHSITSPASPTRSPSRRRAPSICTALLPTAFITKPCWTS